MVKVDNYVPTEREKTLLAELLLCVLTKAGKQSREEACKLIMQRFEELKEKRLNG